MSLLLIIFLHVFPSLQLFRFLFCFPPSCSELIFQSLDTGGELRIFPIPIACIQRRPRNFSIFYKGHFHEYDVIRGEGQVLGNFGLGEGLESLEKLCSMSKKRTKTTYVELVNERVYYEPKESFVRFFSRILRKSKHFPS